MNELRETREEVYNTSLAQILEKKHGLRMMSEVLIHGTHDKPDVMVLGTLDHRRRLVIEAKKGGTGQSRTKAEEQA